MQAEISSIHTVVEGTDFLSGMIASMQAMRATFFRPNTIFLSLTDEHSNDQLYFDLLTQSKKLGYGAYLYIPDKKVGLGLESTIDLWIKAEHIIDMDKKKPRHFNLSLLTAYILRRNWKASLSINILMNGKEDKEQMEFYVQQLYKLSRLPRSISYKYWEGGLKSIIRSGTRSDLNITYMLPDKMEIAKLRSISDRMESSFLFTFDSGIENAFA